MTFLCFTDPNDWKEPIDEDSDDVLAFNLWQVPTEEEWIAEQARVKATRST
jgi:hypothetical protein